VEAPGQLPSLPPPIKCGPIEMPFGTPVGPVNHVFVGTWGTVPQATGNFEGHLPPDPWLINLIL